MASVILKSIGSAVGNMIMPGIGGYLLGSIGGYAGSFIDSAMGLGTNITGPRLENFSVQDSRYGAPIPIIYGNARVAGNVIWSGDLMETKHKSKTGGKGSPSSVSTTSFSYSVHCAIGICAAPIESIKTIWADSHIIYQNGIWSCGFFDDAHIYTGDNNATPDPFMQSMLGASNVPAYKGIAYVVFNNLQLAGFGNRLPSFSFEVIQKSDDRTPSCSDYVSTNISQQYTIIQNAAMPPLVIDGTNNSVRVVLIGGLTILSNTISFSALEYDVSSDSPTLLNSTSSIDFSCSIVPTDWSWAQSPDNNLVIFYAQSIYNPNHKFMIYDIRKRCFGNLYEIQLLKTSCAYKKIVWLDNEHFMLDESVNSIRGVHVFVRSGLNISSMGYTALWDSNSLNTSMPFYGAQWSSCSEGFFAYNYVSATKTLRARTVSWQDNKLVLGNIFTIAASLNLPSGPYPHAQFIQTGTNELTLVYSSNANYSLMSFKITPSGASIVRPWQTFTTTFGTGTTNYPIFFEGKIVIFQQYYYDSLLLYSEINLNTSNFSLSVASAPILNTSNSSNPYFMAFPIDAYRILFISSGGTNYKINRIAIITKLKFMNLADIVSDILLRAGYTTSDFNVSDLKQVPITGYILNNNTSARNATEPLMVYHPFDLVENDGKLVAVTRGSAPVAFIPNSELRASADSENQTPGISTVRAQEKDIPNTINLEFVDAKREFEINCQYAKRAATNSELVQKISLPVVCSPEKAKQIAHIKLFSAWAEMEMISIAVSKAWTHLSPADVIQLSGGSTFRIASIGLEDGLLKINAFYNIPSCLSSDASADGGFVISSSLLSAVPTILHILDIPLLQAAENQSGVYIAMSGEQNWHSANLMRSKDGIDYDNYAFNNFPATCGVSISALNSASACYQDNANEILVQLSHGELSSCTYEALMNGANAALIGDEIIQFQSAILMAEGLWKLSKLLRGRRGTEYAILTHISGERFVLLESNSILFIPAPLSDKNQTYYFRAVSKGQNLGDAANTTFTYKMKTLAPLCPVHVRGERSEGNSGDLKISWIRRARMNSEWLDYIDTPLDEQTEAYEVNILNGNSIIRSFGAESSKIVTYTSQQQTEDWGSNIPPSFKVSIAQISTLYGKGTEAIVNI